jgi:hypothetical protein
MSNSNNETTKLEFLLTLSGNIIVQRFFNVRGYNPKVRKSLDLYKNVKKISEIIEQDLKEKTLEYLHENQHYFPLFDPNNNEGPDTEEYFLLEIKQNDDVFISRVIPAHIFHPKVRYSVDIRPFLRGFLGGLSETFSSTELETNYLGYNLLKNEN